MLTATLAEVDLGQFVTTLPRDPESGVFTTINVHFFGTVTRSRLSAVKKQLRADEYRMRHELLAAVRRSTRDELADPALPNLRARVLKVANQILTDAPVKEVGFYQLTVR
jgi:flagellar basal body-associated protein FliL